MIHGKDIVKYIESESEIYIYIYIYIYMYIYIYVTCLHGNKRVYSQFCIETLHERHNGIQRLVDLFV